jgi:5-methylcytosine-specific restriction endonuclease McrA
MSDSVRTKAKIKKLPASIRQAVWETYIGDQIAKTKCPLCQLNEIKTFQFHCAHVIPRSHGGSDEISNLRPICSLCNNSMYTTNLMTFAKKYFPNSPIHETFPESNEENISKHSEIQTKFVETDQQKNVNVHVHVHNESNKNNETVSAIQKNGYECKYCGYVFSQNFTLTRHLKHYCKVLKNHRNNDTINKMRDELKSEFDKQIAELKKKHTNVTQILQIGCVNNNDSIKFVKKNHQ